MTTVPHTAAILPPLAALLLAMLLVVLLPPAAMAVSCREALDQFERELNESALAAVAPDRYAELARAAEEASELRDEELCMQRVAELRNALAEAADTPPATSGRTPAPEETAAAATSGRKPVPDEAPAPAASNRKPPAPPAEKAPPAAPLLLEPAAVDYPGAPANRSEPEPEHRRLRE